MPLYFVHFSVIVFHSQENILLSVIFFNALLVFLCSFFVFVSQLFLFFLLYSAKESPAANFHQSYFLCGYSVDLH